MGSEWPIVTLGELIENRKAFLQTGPFGTALKAAEYSKSGVPLISVREIREGFIHIGNETPRVDERTTKRLPKFVLKKGDIVFGRKGGVERNALITEDEDGWFLGSDGIFLRLDNVEDAEFISYVMRSPETKTWLLQHCEGTTMPSLNQKILSRLPVFYPPSSVKKKVSNVLRQLDSKIKLNRQTNQTLEAMAQALFKSWFVDFDPVIDNALAAGHEIPEPLQARAEQRKAFLTFRHSREGGNPNDTLDPHLRGDDDMALLPESIRQLFPNRFVLDAQMGWIPDGWKYLAVQKIADVAIGKTPPRKQSQWFSEERSENAVWVSIRDMGSAGCFIGDSSEYLTTQAVEQFNIKVVPKDSIILSFKLTLGRVCIAQCDLTTNEAIAHFVNPQHGLSKEFLYCYLKGFDYNKLGSTSSIATAVNSKIIKEMPVLVPNESVSAAFVSSTEILFKKLSATDLGTKSLTKLRDALLPKLISGELRLPESTTEESHHETAAA